MDIVYVKDKTKKIKIKDGLWELRGNFKEIIKDKEVSYSCNSFRTRKSSDTFDILYNNVRLTELKEYLNSTDWIYAKCAELDLSVSETYPDIVAKRKNAREEIKGIEDE